MNNDKELADKIVGYGVGQAHPKGGVYYFSGPHSVNAATFVRDWGVTGALMEKCVNKPDWMEMHIDRKCSSEAMHRCWIERTHSGIERETYHARNESLPRAINEACVEALE